MPNGHEVVDQMEAAGWARTGDVDFSTSTLRRGRTHEKLVAAAMSAALAPFVPYWLGGFDSAEDAAAADQQRVAQLRLIFDAWAQSPNRNGTRQRRIPCLPASDVSEAETGRRRWRLRRRRGSGR